MKLKVLKGTYPKGYKPKRTSSNMPVFDDQKDDIEALNGMLSGSCEDINECNLQDGGLLGIYNQRKMD